MTTPNPSEKLVRVSREAVPVIKLTAQHEADDRPVSTGNWVRVARPALPVVKLCSEPTAPAVSLRLAVPLKAGDDGPRQVETLRALIAKVNEAESLFGRTGFRIDEARTGVRGNEVEIVMVPTDPADTFDTCERVADFLFTMVHPTHEVAVEVIAADRPERPVYRRAAYRVFTQGSRDVVVQTFGGAGATG